MPATVYALLVGIDAYHSPVPALHGCKNDIQVIHAYLQEREKNTAAFNLKALLLEDDNATRAAVIAGFQRHLTQAQKDDVVLFYYSGHGSQELAPKEFWALEPDHLDETLVLVDSRDPGKYDLADKELAALIKTVSDTGAHVVVILDCCHSGSGTRAPLEDGLVVRRAPVDAREERPLESFLFAGMPALADRQLSGSGWSGLQHGQHVLLAACHSSETAKETQTDGQSRGAFSTALMAALRQIGPEVSYRDLYKRAGALVGQLVNQQTPQLEAIEGARLDQPFLGGKVPARDPYFTLSFDKNLGWLIDGGAVHGVRMRAADDTTTLAIFDLTTPPADWAILQNALGTATVTAVQPGHSSVALSFKDGTAPDTQWTYRAIVTGQPVPALGIWIDPQSSNQPGMKLLRDAMANARGAGQASLFVREVITEAEAVFRVRLEDGLFRITRAGSDRRLSRIVNDIDNQTPSADSLVLARLEHMARWHLTAQLENAGSRISNAIDLKAFIATGSPVTRDPASIPTIPAPETGVLMLEQKTIDVPAEYKIRLHNTSKEPLYCALLYLDEAYSVNNDLLECTLLEAGAEAWAYLGIKPVQSWVEETWYKAGITEVHDRIKLIVSTAKFDATLMTQAALPVKILEDRDATKRSSPIISNSLEMLMHRVNTRAGGQHASSAMRFADWTTGDLSIVTTCPLEGRTLPNQGQTVSLGSNVTLEGHPALRGQVRLTNLPQVARDLENHTLPPLLASSFEAWEPWSFEVARGGSPGLTALELNGVENADQVTPDQPLLLRVENTTLGEGETILATAYDAETQLYLPLGIGTQDGTRVSLKLERLPTAISERSLVGAIRILFQKFVAKKIGLDFQYPLLREVTVQPDGQVTYSRPDQVEARVATASRILLFVHGIIGDSQSMVGCLASTDFKLKAQYDLILTFDFESINDGIIKNATDLKTKLENAGLRAGHDKTLHVVAHSMGGLISRYFIEQLGGNTVIGKLVMLGTPNAGSPWATVQTWATSAVAVGINLLGTVAWPIKAVASLVGLIEKIDQNLDDMQAGSAVLNTLKNSSDPGVEYVLICGDVLLDVQKRPLLERLIKKLGTETIFLAQANDIAASVSSVMSVNGTRSPIPEKFDTIACDHLSYFRTSVGISALNQALG